MIATNKTSAAILGQYFRYEITYDKFISEGGKGAAIGSSTYYIQWQDILTLLQNLETKNPTIATADREWNTAIYSLVCDGALQYLDASCMKEIGELFDYVGEVPDCLARAMDFVVLCLVQTIDFGQNNCPDSTLSEIICFDALREDVERLAGGDFASIRPIFWSDAMKSQYLYKLINAIWAREMQQLGESFRMKFCRDWEAFSQEKKDTIHALVEELVPKGYVHALELKAICCYGGNCIYACDWQLSHEYLVRLMNIPDDVLVTDVDKCRYALLLGNIYFEGLLSGTPDYEKAAYYYSVGAIAEDYDCIYRLAKMNLLGLGVPKNVRNAYILIDRFCTEEQKLFLQGKLDGYIVSAIDIRRQSLQRLEEIYPKGIPDFAWERYRQELEYIVSYNREKEFQFIARLSGEARRQNAYLMFRGPISGSLLLHLLCDNLYNPLPAHYYCPACGHYELAKGERFCLDLPQKNCPVCASALRRDGFSVPLVGAFGVDGKQLQNRWDINVSEPFLHTAQKLLKLSGLKKITFLSDPFYCAQIEDLQKKSGRLATELLVDDLKEIGWRELAGLEETAKRSEYLRLIQPTNFRQLVALTGVLHGSFEGMKGELPPLPKPYAEMSWAEALEKYPFFLRDDLYEYLLKDGIPDEKAARLSEHIGKGKFLFSKHKDDFVIPDCVQGFFENVRYLMSRAHIVEYLLADIRFAYLQGLCPEVQEGEPDEVEVPVDEEWLISVEKIRSTLRFDQNYEHLAPEEKLARGFVIPTCQVDLEDIRILLHNLQSINPPVRQLLPWMWDASQLLRHILSEGEKGLYEEAIFDRSMYRSHLNIRPKHSDEAKYFVLDAIIDAVVFEVYLANDRKERRCTDCIDFEKIGKDIELFAQGRFSETMPMFWSNVEKLRALETLQEDAYSREQIPKEAWAQCPALLKELIDKEYFDALKIKKHFTDWYTE